MITQNIVYNIVRNGSLWSNVVFEKNDFRPEAFLRHLKAHKVVQQGVFSIIIFINLNNLLSQIFTDFNFCILWVTPSEDTGLWQLPNVSSAYNDI